MPQSETSQVQGLWWPRHQRLRSLDLLDSIPNDLVSGLRDLARIATMFYSFALVSAVLTLKADDYYHNGTRRRLRLHEKGGKEQDYPVHRVKSEPHL